LINFSLKLIKFTLTEISFETCYGTLADENEEIPANNDISG